MPSLDRARQATADDRRGIFRFNPGAQKKTFPDYNPYTISRCRDCDLSRQREQTELAHNLPSAADKLRSDIAKGNLSLAHIPENEFCSACPLIRKCEADRFEVIRRFDNGGSFAVHSLVNSKDSDYKKLMDIAEHFASLGKEVRLTPKMSRRPKFVYQNIYGSLMGTKYEGKCPDLWVDGVWYEHEGFVSDNPKRAFKNMLNHGLKQSDRLIIDKPDLSDAYMKRVIRQRVKNGQAIEEIWLKDGSEYQLLYKKFEE